MTAAAPPRAAAPCRCSRDRTCSDRLLEKFPSVPNSSVLLVQADEGFLFPVVDLIRRIYRRLLLRLSTQYKQADNGTEAYTTAHNIHAQFNVVKQAHIRTSSLLCYNYYNGIPSNTSLTPSKPNTDTNSGTVTQKPRIGSYKLNPSLSYPSNTTEGSKQSTRYGLTPQRISTYSNDVAQVHYRNWTRHPLLRSESLAQLDLKPNTASLSKHSDLSLNYEDQRCSLLSLTR
ncbi:hypothetical protein F511_08679 [Dorcoceras hygrometricum]|uniref:Uncharacterized protein n=1 Tax=Dorcoceras hygrometricum TaxID=472368 RepID=A0A2Z7CN70_9LAMI|nr:hypothetical protein F511_08679 [Dorcoceras hygrometricum]